MDPLISVVIPTFNRAMLLRETLESVFDSTEQRFEIVVVDDGSTDDTERVLRSLTSDHRLRIIRQENSGVGAARNRGISAARGQYVATLDHDDLWKPEKLAQQLDFMQSHDTCIASSCLVSLIGTPSRPTIDLARIHTCDGIVVRPLRALASQWFLITSALMFRRAHASNLRFGETKGCIEDVQFFIELALLGEIGLVGQEPLVIYRHYDGNESKRVSYHYDGLCLLHQMEQRGMFSTRSDEQRKDVRALLAAIMRSGSLKMLGAGWVRHGLYLYALGWPLQCGNRRWRYLAAFPILAAWTAVRALTLPKRANKASHARPSLRSQRAANTANPVALHDSHHRTR